jgi:hypothetical protein
VLQHLLSCTNPERQLTVQLQCLTHNQEQKLALKSTLTQVPKKSDEMLPAVNVKIVKPTNKVRKKKTVKVVQKKARELQECPICKLQFKNLYMHLRQAHLPKKIEPEFTCDVPGCTFTRNSLQLIKTHKLSVHNLERRQCHLCEMVFVNYGSKRLHLQRHMTPTEGIFKCLFRACNKTMPQSELKKHLEEHMSVKKEPTFECEHCGTFLAKKALLESHRNIHFSKLPGQLHCVYAACKSYFCNSVDLRAHMQIHTQKAQKPQFVCSECEKMFPSDLELKHHLKSHLTKEKAPAAQEDFMCQYCDLPFLSNQTYSSHLKRHETETPGELKCLLKDCQQRVASAAALKEHSVAHKVDKYIRAKCAARSSEAFKS